MIHLTHHGIDSPQVTKVKHELLGVPGVNVSFFGSICDWGRSQLRWVRAISSSSWFRKNRDRIPSFLVHEQNAAADFASYVGWHFHFDYNTFSAATDYLFPILCSSILPIGSMYGIYANIWGILMGSMLPYIAYMDPMGYVLGFEVLTANHGEIKPIQHLETKTPSESIRFSLRKEHWRRRTTGRLGFSMFFPDGFMENSDSKMDDGWVYGYPPVTWETSESSDDDPGWFSLDRMFKVSLWSGVSASVVEMFRVTFRKTDVNCLFQIDVNCVLMWIFDDVGWFCGWICCRFQGRLRASRNIARFHWTSVAYPPQRGDGGKVGERDVDFLHKNPPFTDHSYNVRPPNDS